MMPLDLSTFLINYSPLIRQTARDSQLEIDDVRHFSIELLATAKKNGKGVGWVIKALQRTCRHAGRPSGFLNLDDDGQTRDQLADLTGPTPEDFLLIAEAQHIRQRQLKMFGNDCLVVLDAFGEGTEGFAVRIGVTQRRAQQLLKGLVDAIDSARSNDEMTRSLSLLATRINKSDLLKRAQVSLFDEVA